MAPITTVIAICACLVSPFVLGQSDPLTDALNQAGTSSGADPGAGLGASSLSPAGDSSPMGNFAAGSDAAGGNTVLPGLGETETGDSSPASANCTGTECDDEEAETQERDTRRRAAKTENTGQCGAAGDSDKDGICDDSDACLNSPEGVAVLPSGCHLHRNSPLLLEGVRFEVASARLTAESRAVLDQAVAVLKASPQLPVTVDGHTDNSGSRKENQRLSEDRAEAVYRYFIERGVAADRLAYRGFGERQPRAPNNFEDGRDYPAGRAENRRVELSVLPPEQFAEVSAQNAERQRARRLAREAEAQRQREALAAEQQAEVRREKAAQAQEDYKQVLEFLEETGTADTRREDAAPDDDDKEATDDDSDYSLEVTEPEP